MINVVENVQEFVEDAGAPTAGAAVGIVAGSTVIPIITEKLLKLQGNAATIVNAILRIVAAAALWVKGDEEDNTFYKGLGIGVALSAVVGPLMRKTAEFLGQHIQLNSDVSSIDISEDVIKIPDEEIEVPRITLAEGAGGE